MAQYDLHEIEGLLVVDLQSDVIGLDLTRLVAPLRESGQYEYLPRLTPKVDVAGKSYVVHIHDMATVRRSRLGEPVGNLTERADDLLRALDILTRGF